RQTYETTLTDLEWRIESHKSGVAKHRAWFAEIDRMRNQYIPRRTQVSSTSCSAAVYTQIY
ncbi:MAG: hypothetical protein QGG39_16760, partial [Candidatus Poribacteria bacterium]|nr:hypothetical protein [Candidatus Poribacteria bacterium]